MAHEHLISPILCGRVVEPSDVGSIATLPVFNLLPCRAQPTLDMEAHTNVMSRTTRTAGAVRSGLPLFRWDGVSDVPFPAPTGLAELPMQLNGVSPYLLRQLRYVP